MSPHAIGEIYSDNDQGGVDLVVGVGKLESSTATASKQIALLVSAGRQLAELEQWLQGSRFRNPGLVEFRIRHSPPMASCNPNVGLTP